MKINRLEAIRHHLYTSGETSIQALAEAIGASLATVRRDLQILEQQGVISRTHGTARIANGVHAALVGSGLGAGVLVLADDKRARHHAARKSQSDEDLKGQREIVPDVWVALHRHL